MYIFTTKEKQILKSVLRDFCCCILRDMGTTTYSATVVDFYSYKIFLRDNILSHYCEICNKSTK